jgi:uncharacterized protein (TIGR02271 family)
MARDESEVVVPVVAEQLHVDAEPVETGGVRVVKRVVGHDEVVEQELHKNRSEIKRVKVDRVVDGPQPVRKVGNTVIVPVVSETLIIQKQWVLTEEIHIVQHEERETVRQNVTVNHEEATIERFDETGNTTSVVEPETIREAQSVGSEKIFSEEESGISPTEEQTMSRDEQARQRPRSILKSRSRKA